VPPASGRRWPLAGSLLGVGKSAAEVLIVLIPITLLSGLAVLRAAGLPPA
jgi:hypothetical protein